MLATLCAPVIDMTAVVPEPSVLFLVTVTEAPVIPNAAAECVMVTLLALKLITPPDARNRSPHMSDDVPKAEPSDTAGDSAVLVS